MDEQPTDKSAPWPLEYAQEKKWLSARAAKRIASFVLLIVAAVLIWRFGPRLWQPVHAAYLQPRALAYSAPDGFCVVGQERVNVDRGSFEWSGTQSSPDPWRDYLDAAGMRNGPWLFVGRRRSRSGHDRIVAVYEAGTLSFTQIASTSPDFEHYFGLVGLALSPGTVIALPKVLQPTHAGLGGAVPVDPPFQIFAGQADAADSSHFTIVYQVGEQRGTIDGWLQDNDAIKLQIRDGPAIPGTIQSAN